MNPKQRPITNTDTAILLRIYASTREAELAIVPWTAEQKSAFVSQQFDVQHRYYQEHYAGAAFDLLLLGDEPIGRLYVARSVDEILIIDIALLPGFRGIGIGTRLICELFDEADASGKTVSIHVEINNPARRLYDRLGFQPLQERGIYLRMERPPRSTTGVAVIAQVNTAS